MPAYLRIALFLVLCLPMAPAHADSWRPPSRKVYTSADGTTRLTVDPRPIGSALEYFSDKVDDKSPAGQPAGEAQTTPLGQLERRDDGGQWRTLWRQPLVNDVAPVEAVVANGGARVVTFDNWHSVGLGDDVVVIYDHAGKPLRELSLAQLLPPHYPLFLPRSASSLWWRRGASVSADGQWLVLQVVEPGVESRMAEAPPTVPVRVRLVDGEVQPFEGEGWPRVHARLAERVAQRDRAWQAYRMQRSQSLLPPAGDDPKAWRAYLVELRERLGDDDHHFAGLVVQARAGSSPVDNANGVRFLLGEFEAGGSRGYPDMVFVSPDGAALADLLAGELANKPADSYRGARIAFLATPDEFARVERAVAHTGVQLLRLDAATPVPGQALPESAPDHFVGMPPHD